jgi:hypothetical protein
MSGSLSRPVQRTITAGRTLLVALILVAAAVLLTVGLAMARSEQTEPTAPGPPVAEPAPNTTVLPVTSSPTPGAESQPGCPRSGPC